ncbi:hypothetical protein [Pontibacter sp. SGAir0037]|uniref:hypothetical protein n=1 Tax=Pontibacter sp. SGAir0037 TaxID=2571030 RepID=UPI0010F49F48|nr:hypothetical protein [Pontibacter sp. SGAir0037]
MLRYSFFLLLTLPLYFSCSSGSSTDKEAEQAYQDLRNFVADVEQDTAMATDVTEAAWEEEADQLLEEYSKHESKADEYREHYSVEKREEIKALEERFELAYEKRQKLYDDVSRRYRLRQDMLGVEVAADDLSTIQADNITATYQKFINTLHSNKELYTARDWEHIEGWWSALNDRRQEV